MRNTGCTQTHFHAAEHSDECQSITFTQVPNPEYFAGYLTQSLSQRHVVILKHDTAEIVGIMAGRHHDGGQNGGMFGFIATQDFQSPGPDCSPGCRRQFLMAGKDAVETFFQQDGNGFP